jgi:hypothetical protein
MAARSESVDGLAITVRHTFCNKQVGLGLT